MKDRIDEIIEENINVANGEPVVNIRYAMEQYGKELLLKVSDNIEIEWYGEGWPKIDKDSILNTTL